MIRKAKIEDLKAIEEIYESAHKEEKAQKTTTGWLENVYPTSKTALEAIKREDMFVLEGNGIIVASAVINKIQVKEYEDCTWENDPEPEKVMVLHTLVVSSEHKKRGYGKIFVKYYEDYALENGCNYLRMDTNEKNLIAREVYKKLGYSEAGIVSSIFNGIEGMKLVCLEKKI